MAIVIGRKKESSRLERLLKSDKAEFLAIYGRRRVGKTFLIDEFFRGKGLFFEIMGTKKATRIGQLRKFHREWANLFGNAKGLPQPKDWGEALYRLKESVEAIPASQKVILFFDELPWLATKKSGFLSELDYIWNLHFSKMPNVLVVICGSAASWMIKNIIRNRDGLYGRLSEQIRLNPFTLHEVEEYLTAYQINLNRKQLVELYMMIGGVAKYLTFIPRGRSTAQIIDELCFSTHGPLLTEFNDLYQSLFDNSERHIAVVRALAAKKSGMTRNQISEETQIPSGGRLSIILTELEESGFIMSTQEFGVESSERSYRLVDEYSLFYLHWIEPRRSEILHGTATDIWPKLQASQKWKIWSGYAFENICFKHISEIKKALGLAGVTTVHSQWSAYQEAQVDMVIDRADQCINLVEEKFCEGEFTVTKEYAARLQRKKGLFREKTGTKKAIFTTLITPYGATVDANYLAAVDNQLTINDLF